MRFSVPLEPTELFRPINWDFIIANNHPKLLSNGIYTVADLFPLHVHDYTNFQRYLLAKTHTFGSFAWTNLSPICFAGNKKTFIVFQLFIGQKFVATRLDLLWIFYASLILSLRVVRTGLRFIWFMIDNSMQLVKRISICWKVSELFDVFQVQQFSQIFCHHIED